MLETLIARGTLAPNAISMVATSSGHITLYNAATPIGGERYLFNASLYVNLNGIKPNWTGVWFLTQTGTIKAPRR